MTNYERGVLAPFLVRWPKNIPVGLIRNGISAHEDVLPTIMAVVDEPDIKDELKEGKTIGDMTYKVYIDGFNNLDYWEGKTDKSARNYFFYYYESSLTAMRVGPWKMHFATKERYFDDMVSHTMPQLFNLRKDPFEQYDNITGFHMIMNKSWVMQPAIGILSEHLATFKDYPPQQAAASLDINKAVESILKSDTRQ